MIARNQLTIVLLLMIAHTVGCQQRLTSDLEGGDPAKREAAINQLIHSPQKKAIPALITSLQDPDFRIREKSIVALNQAGAPALHPLLNACQDEERIVQIGAIRALGNPNPMYNLDRKFSSAEDVQAYPVLITTMHSKDSHVRASACESICPVSIGANKVRDGLEYLIGALSDPDASVRYAATSSIGCLAIGSKRPKLFAIAVPPLTRMLSDGSPNVRGRAAWTLGRIASVAKGAIPELVTALADTQEQVRNEIVETLAKLGTFDKDRTVRLLLSAMLGTNNKDYRLGCLFSLRRLRPLPSFAVSPLLSIIGDQSSQVNRLLAMTLGDMGVTAHEAVPALRGLLDSKDAQVRITAAWAIARISAAPIEMIPLMVVELRNRDATVRAHAANVLGDFGSAANSAVPLLRQLAKLDASESVRRAANVALRRIANSQNTQ